MHRGSKVKDGISRCMVHCWAFGWVWVIQYGQNLKGEFGVPGGSDSKASAHNAGNPGSIPRLGRSLGEGNGNPLQYSCLENSMDGGA